jgi:RNA polymerase sigma factor (TIGR02999 family)
VVEVATLSEPINEASHTPASAIEADALFAQVYARLKAMASRQLAERRSATLDTTALVHELYLRMCKRELAFEHPAQFFAYAARAMRHLLSDRARDRLRLRAGGGWLPVTLQADAPNLAVGSAEEVLALEEAMQRLEGTDPRAARVVELRYFIGLSLEETAATLGLARRTVDRDWRFARAFLQEQLG